MVGVGTVKVILWSPTLRSCISGRFNNHAYLGCCICQSIKCINHVNDVLCLIVYINRLATVC